MSAEYSIVHFASLDWRFRKQDQHFIAADLAALGHPVTFVENTGARFPGLQDLPRVTDRLRNFMRGAATAATPLPSGLHVVSPLCIPGASRGYERALNMLLLRAQLASVLDTLHRPTVLLVTLPTWTAVDTASLVRADIIVYYCGDAFDRLPGLRRGIVESERALLRRADIVFATSSALLEHCRQQRPDPVLLPIAVDLSASEAAREGHTPVPAELEGLPGRIIGYMGGLNAKVDVGILEAVCDRFADDTVVVVGSVEDHAFRPRAAPNLVILGERPYEDVAAYISRFAVCLIPYVLNAFTEAVNPAKLIEYLAVGRPVVSTPLREVLPFSDVVRVAHGTEAFVSAVADVLATPDTAQAREERIRRAKGNSHERIAARVDAEIQRALAGASREGDRPRS